MRSVRLCRVQMNPDRVVDHREDREVIRDRVPEALHERVIGTGLDIVAAERPRKRVIAGVDRGVVRPDDRCGIRGSGRGRDNRRGERRRRVAGQRWCGRYGGRRLPGREDGQG